MFLPPAQFVKSTEEMQRAYTLDESRRYTRWLANHHYENFHVVTFLLPWRLRQDFYNVYAFCRWADDLGDEIGDIEESLRLLGWWRGELDAMYEGEARHPVYVALADTVARHNLPKEPFVDLIRAFVQDQTVTRYADWDDVFEYCRYSANPVGRLVLYLCGYRDDERQALADATCTALQLANFWQDISADLQKGRIYIPLDAMERYGYTEEDLQAGRESPAFRAVMREIVGISRELFERGLPLAKKVDRRLAADIDLFSRGGMLILEKIEAQDYNVLRRRPAITKSERAGLLLQALGRLIFPRME